MRDRFTRGLLAGAVAGIAPYIVNHGAYALNLTTLRWVDFMNVFITGSKPDNPGELAFAIVAEFAFLGICGMLFAFLVPLVSSVNLWLKGLVYGALIWFITYFATITFRLPELVIPLKTAVTSLTAGLIWGLILSLILGRLDRLVESS